MRKQEEEKAPNHERWLITYSDLITLLMIFFIIMYALSQVDANKFKSLASALATTMGGSAGSGVLEGGPTVDTNSSGANLPTAQIPNQPNIPQKPIDKLQEVTKYQKVDDDTLRQQQITKQLMQVQSNLNSYIKEKGLEANLNVTLENRGLVLSIKDAILFDSGSAELTPQAFEIIKRVGSILLQLPNNISIEGHTDNLPLRSPRYKTNWELSVGRAVSVVHILIDTLHFPPGRLAIMGYGEYKPVVPNDSEEHRRINRRVDIVIMRQPR